MDFKIRVQRAPLLATPADMRADVNLQKVASAVERTYMKKDAPTSADTVKAAIEQAFPNVQLNSGIEYHQYSDPVTGKTYWCCTFTNTLTVDISGQDPIVVELMKTELVP